MLTPILTLPANVSGYSPYPEQTLGLLALNLLLEMTQRCGKTNAGNAGTFAGAQPGLPGIPASALQMPWLPWVEN